MHGMYVRKDSFERVCPVIFVSGESGPDVTLDFCWQRFETYLFISVKSVSHF